MFICTCMYMMIAKIAKLMFSPPRVIVVVTPGPNVHSIALATDEQARVVQGQCGADRVYTNPPANYSLFAVTNININWCQFQVSSRKLCPLTQLIVMCEQLERLSVHNWFCHCYLISTLFY